MHEKNTCLWQNDAAENSYAEGMEFHVFLDTVEEIADVVMWLQKEKERLRMGYI